MKTYLITTAGLFALIALVHLWRIVEEWPRLATDPWYLLLTVAAACLAFWAWRLIRLSVRRAD